LTFLLISISCSAPAQTQAEPPTPAGPVARFFATGGVEERTLAVESLTTRPGYAPERLPELLHGAGLFADLAPGRMELAVPVGHGRTRRVVVRVPAGYRSDRPWPLLLAYHPSGGSAEPMLAAVERLLGERVEERVVAAPHHYRQTVLDHPLPVSSEHAEVLRAIRERLHVDSDRVHLFGTSLGGYTAWTLATLHADLFAGAVPLASAFSFPADVPGLWPAFFPNFRHLPILSVWGGRDRLDVPGLAGRRSAGDMSSLNRRLAPLLAEHGAGSVVHLEVPRAGHGGFRPPADALARVLAAERVHHPTAVRHLFRYVHQAQAYWIEGHEWSGPLWDRPWPEVRRGRGENEGEALWRVIRELLGEIRGEIRGQTLEVETRHLADLTVWVGDGMIDWRQPVTVIHNRREVFRGRLAPDPGLALAQARRTRDLDRLRWAGVRIDAAAGTARVVTADDPYPPVLREVLGE
jgi:pimeloyl-ACP methyl ester carboxylesterase